MINLLRILAAVVLALTTSVGAEAQDSEHVLMDMQVWVTPPQGSGYCAQLEAGTFTAELQAVGQGSNGRGQPWPVEFSFYGYRGFDDPATIDTTVSSLAPTSVSAPLQGGGLYCFSLTNLVQVSANAPNAVTTQYWQGMNVRMTIQR